MIDTSKPMEVFDSVWQHAVKAVDVINVGFSAYPYVVRVADRPAPICFNENGDDLTRTYQLRTLPPVKVERKYWFNHYEGSSIGPFPDKENADRWANHDLRIGCTEVDLTFYKGQGI